MQNATFKFMHFHVFDTVANWRNVSRFLCGGDGRDAGHLFKISLLSKRLFAFHFKALSVRVVSLLFCEAFCDWKINHD